MRVRTRRSAQLEAVTLAVMPAPDMRAHLEGLAGQTLSTVTGKDNTVMRVDGSSVYVATEQNAQGAPIPISFIQAVADRVFDGEEVVFDPQARSAFLGAVLRTFPEVE